MMVQVDIPDCPFCGSLAMEKQTKVSLYGYKSKIVYCQGCSASANKKDWDTRFKIVSIQTKEYNWKGEEV